MEFEYELIRKEDVLPFISRMRYGSKVVKYDSDEALLEMTNAILAYNQLSSAGIFQDIVKEDVYDDVEKKYLKSKKEVEGYYRFICTNKDNLDREIITSNDMALFDFEPGVILNINPELEKLAKKLGKKEGLIFKANKYELARGKSLYNELRDRFINGETEVILETEYISFNTVISYCRRISEELSMNVKYSIFDGKYRLKVNNNHKERVSALFLIESAINSKQKIVSFDLTTNKITTLRQYCSALSSKHNVAIRCNTYNSKAVVYIGIVDELDIELENLKETLTTLKTLGADYGIINNIFGTIFNDESAFDETPEETERIRLRDEEIQKQWDAKNGIGIDLHISDFIQDVEDEFGPDDEF